MRRAKSTFHCRRGRGFMTYRMEYGQYKIFNGYSFTAEFGREVIEVSNPFRRYFHKETPRNCSQELVKNLNYNFDLSWSSRNFLNYYPEK